MSFAPTPPLKRSSIYTYRKEAPRISSSTTASSVTALASAVFTPDQEPAAKRVAIDERNTLQDLPFEIFAKIWTPERISGGHFYQPSLTDLMNLAKTSTELKEKVERIVPLSERKIYIAQERFFNELLKNPQLYSELCEIKVSEFTPALNAREAPFWQLKTLKTALDKRIANLRFGDLTTKALHDLFYLASRSGYSDLLQAIINCHQFADIHPSYLGWAFADAAKQNTSDNLMALISCRRFDDIYFTDFKWALSIAAELNTSDNLLVLMNCNHFDDVDPYALAWVLRNAAKTPHNLRILIECTRFDDIELVGLIWVLLDTAKQSTSDNLMALINCSRFNEIPSEYLQKALDKSTPQNAEILKALIAQAPLTS